MRILTRLHYEMQHLASRLAAPIMRRTGYRFGKDWRGNRWINHVEANCMADGIPAKAVKCPVRW